MQPQHLKLICSRLNGSPASGLPPNGAILFLSLVIEYRICEKLEGPPNVTGLGRQLIPKRVIN